MIRRKTLVAMLLSENLWKVEERIDAVINDIIIYASSKEEALKDAVGLFEKRAVGDREEAEKIHASVKAEWDLMLSQEPMAIAKAGLQKIADGEPNPQSIANHTLLRIILRERRQEQSE